MKNTHFFEWILNIDCFNSSHFYGTFDMLMFHKYGKSKNWSKMYQDKIDNSSIFKGNHCSCHVKPLQEFAFLLDSFYFYLSFLPVSLPSYLIVTIYLLHINCFIEFILCIRLSPGCWQYSDEVCVCSFWKLLFLFWRIEYAVIKYTR